MVSFPVVLLVFVFLLIAFHVFLIRRVWIEQEFRVLFCWHIVFRFIQRKAKKACKQSSQNVMSQFRVGEKGIIIVSWRKLLPLSATIFVRWGNCKASERRSHKFSGKSGKFTQLRNRIINGAAIGHGITGFYNRNPLWQLRDANSNLAAQNRRQKKVWSHCCALFPAVTSRQAVRNYFPLCRAWHNKQQLHHKSNPHSS